MWYFGIFSGIAGGVGERLRPEQCDPLPVASCSHSNGHIPSSGLHPRGFVATVRTPKRLSLAYFIARTRLVQKIVMVRDCP